MRWGNRPRAEQRHYRLRGGFMWLPKRIGEETRWLECAVWSERYFTGIRSCAWIAEEWIA